MPSISQVSSTHRAPENGKVGRHHRPLRIVALPRNDDRAGHGLVRAPPRASVVVLVVVPLVLLASSDEADYDDENYDDENDIIKEGIKMEGTDANFEGAEDEDDGWVDFEDEDDVDDDGKGEGEKGL